MPNIEQHEEMPRDTAMREARRTRFFMLGNSLEGEREKFHMQQHDDRLRAKVAAARRVVRRRNMLKMLGTRAGLAIKKTLGFLQHRQLFRQWIEPSRRSGGDSEVVHVQCVASRLREHRSSTCV